MDADKTTDATKVASLIYSAVTWKHGQAFCGFKSRFVTVQSTIALFGFRGRCTVVTRDPTEIGITVGSGHPFEYSA